MSKKVISKERAIEIMQGLREQRAPLFLRQGDVYIEELRDFKDDTKFFKPGNHLVVATGEVTGHAHELVTIDALEAKQKHGAAIDASATYDQVMEELEGLRFSWADGENGEKLLKIKGAGAVLLHEDHAAIPVPPSETTVFRFYHQREYDPVQRQRNVRD